MSRVVKNLKHLTIAEFLLKSSAFLINIIAARKFAVEDFGEIGYASALITYCALLINFGFDTLATREVAKDPANYKQIFYSVFKIKFTIALCVFTLLLAVLFIFRIEPFNIILAYSFTLLLIPINLFWMFNGLQDTFRIFLSKLIEAVVYVGVGIFLINFLNNIIGIPIALAVSQLFAYSFYLSRGKLGNVQQLQKGGLAVKKIIRDSIPLGISSLFVLVYYNLDLIMLGAMQTDYDVGVYNAAYKIFVLGTIPFTLILNSFFPSLSRIGLKDSQEFKENLVKFFKFLGVIGFLCFTVIFLLAEFIIYYVYGEKFVMAVLPLKILSINIFFVAMNMFLANPVIAWGKSKVYLLIVGSGALMNIVFNFYLIPRYSFYGAAISTLIAELTVFSVASFFFYKYTARIFFPRKNEG